MANIILFFSSIISSFIHLFYLYFYKVNIYYLLFIIFSLLISIINHSMTNNFYKYTDRFTMFVGLFVTYYKCHNYILKLLLFLIIPFYLLSKKYNNIYFHILCHAFITYINISIIKKN